MSRNSGPLEGWARSLTSPLSMVTRFPVQKLHTTVSLEFSNASYNKYSHSDTGDELFSVADSLDFFSGQSHQRLRKGMAAINNMHSYQL